MTNTINITIIIRVNTIMCVWTQNNNPSPVSSIISTPSAYNHQKQHTTVITIREIIKKLKTTTELNTMWWSSASAAAECFTLGSETTTRGMKWNWIGKQKTLLYKFFRSMRWIECWYHWQSNRLFLSLQLISYAIRWRFVKITLTLFGWCLN